MKVRSLLQYRKDPRFVVAIPFLILIATSLIYYLIQQANELSAEALSNRLVLFALWNINLILILGILFVLLRMGIKLLLERHRGILGSRFRTKLVATYMLISLIPIILLFVVANDLLRMSIDRWFNMPVEEILRNGETIAQAAQQQAIDQAARAARELADRSGTSQNLDRNLEHIRRYHDVDLIGTYRDGIAIKLLANPRAPIHEVREPSADFFQQITEHGSAEKIDVVPSGKWIRFGVAAGDHTTTLAGIFIPDRLNRLIDENIIAHRNFLQLDSQRPSLKASQTSLFLTVTLAVLFGALWISIHVSRRITVPVQALAEGTRTLAEGDYTHRIQIHATDEFDVLIGSFNTMADQLQTQREALTQSNLELQTVNRRLDEERAYLSTVLESVSTGIVAIGNNLELLSINPAAIRMLQIPVPDESAAIRSIFTGELTPLMDYVDTLRRNDFRSREMTLIRGGELRYLDISGSRLGGVDEPIGWVVALEETTQLVQAQKLAAWSEAARRIAHEIKNPLTPIQLSAERIARRFRESDEDLPAIIEEGTRTIVSEVRHLQRMVDEFSRFARMPAVHLQQTGIQDVLQQVAQLFCEVKDEVSVRVDCDPELQALVDPEQLRRAMINLLDNAVAATDRGEIVIAARRLDRSLRITVTDPGRGVPDADKERLFLPYFSTKKEGTGLGLAIVHRIIHDHDGRISVHDQPPRGTRFEIEIPA